MATRKKAIQIVEEIDFPTNDRCETCRFFEEDEEISKDLDESAGWCLRMPPYVIATSEGILSVCAQARSAGWCGEHKPKLNA